MVAAVKRYRRIGVMPEGLSSERVAIARAFGAEVRLAGTSHVNDAVKRANLTGNAGTSFRSGSNRNGTWTETANRWARRSSCNCRTAGDLGTRDIFRVLSAANRRPLFSHSLSIPVVDFHSLTG